MPKDEFDHEDPMTLVSIPMPEGDRGNQRCMARCLAEEYIRMGFSEEELLSMFRNPFYSILHGVHLSLGDEAVRNAIAEARDGWIPAGNREGA